MSYLNIDLRNFVISKFMNKITKSLPSETNNKIQRELDDFSIVSKEDLGKDDIISSQKPQYFYYLVYIFN